MDDLKSLIPVSYDNPERPTVSGRELHEFLQVGTKYADWFKRMCEGGLFTEHVDFESCFSNLGSEKQHGGQNKVDHQLTISMAKELCMIQHKSTGEWNTKNTTVWTEAGQRFIYEQLKAVGMLPSVERRQSVEQMELASRQHNQDGVA